ncbi:hypothetical protein F751_0014 [Auxenochlorella protothecoides]|uniref:Uncharacterized protein n=1 Tax=Auxenochlorella protothecoides TaxID=3075 RepID=A0A087S9H3_AUXPR|nr:hypothetical protein F751_0014 [Auxenochlorella protothecoides]KFM22377.1 hypothetical protein F751_0014 [Auxenochlorella protothecoides]
MEEHSTGACMVALAGIHARRLEASMGTTRSPQIQTRAQRHRQGAACRIAVALRCHIMPVNTPGRGNPDSASPIRIPGLAELT